MRETGQTVVANMMRTDTVNLGSMMIMVADMIPPSAGTWLCHCHVNNHFEGGMYARFTVTP
ncbi:multicopper oxidase domain-containing protein [Nevskia soli]|uniref:multicopper oxidase domain-containing protein n=1 Tax=Nevskia soli TaxID=418856 RepID=UPI0015D75CFA|nr:multicopper oxidase domain-containing protein [Nevskia soli]